MLRTRTAPPIPYQLSADPLVVLELSDVTFDVPIDAGQFDYNPRDVDWVDQTAKVLERLRKQRQAAGGAARRGRAGAVARSEEHGSARMSSLTQLHAPCSLLDRANCPAVSIAATMPSWLAVPCQARSNAVPWATLVRTIGRPSVMFTAACMPKQLQRDVALVVIHGHDGVELAVAGGDHQRVGRQRAGDVEAAAAGLGDGRGDDRPFFVAETVRLRRRAD